MNKMKKFLQKVIGYLMLNANVMAVTMSEPQIKNLHKNEEVQND